MTELLQSLGTVHLASDVPAFLAALEQESYDLVISSPADLLAADARADEPPLGTVLNTIGQGVGIIDPQGAVVWCNHRFKELPAEVVERIRDCCLQAWEEGGGQSTTRRQRFLNLVTTGEGCYEARVTSVADESPHAPRLVAVVSEVTRARRLQKKMDAIDNAGRELVRLDADELTKMDVRQRLELLERKILRYIRELLQFDNFAIRLLDKNTNRLEMVLCAGLPIEAQQIEIYASPENSGISGYVAATGRSYICPDIRNDARYLPGIDNARSSLTVPLRLHDQVIGVLNIESDRLATFTEDDRQFAEIFGRYVGIALHILDLLIVERHTTTGRLADDVSSEIAGPLGDILADATTLMEDYIGHDDLRHRLQAIADNVVRIRESIKEVTQPVTGILRSKGAPPEADPLLDGKRVLVIDDEEVIRLTVRDVLSKSGCVVDIARDGTGAQAMIHQRTYDLVISDIRMPGKDGYEIFAAVKDVNPACPVIFMTGFGYDPNHTIIRARAEGLASVLYKPFKVDQLLGDVRVAISSASESKG